MRRIAVQVDRVGIEWEAGGRYSLFWEGSFSLVTDKGRMVMGVWRKESEKRKPLIICEYRLRASHKEEIARLIDRLLAHESAQRGMTGKPSSLA